MRRILHMRPKDCVKHHDERRIKPYSEQEAEKAGREEQRRVFRRNEAFGC